jgi:hypothetical protein
MLNKIKTSFNVLLEASKKGGWNPNNFDIYVDKEQYLKEISRVNSIDVSEKNVLIDSSDPVTENECEPFAVKMSVAAKVFDCSKASVTKNKVPGVTYKGPVFGKHEGSFVEIDLKGELSNLGLTQEHFLDGGEKFFYKSSEVLELFNTKSYSKIRSRFEDDELLKIGSDHRYPIPKVKEALRNRTGHYASNSFLPGGIKVVS